LTRNDSDRIRFIDTGSEGSRYSADNMTNETQYVLNIKLPSAWLVLWI